MLRATLSVVHYFVACGLCLNNDMHNILMTILKLFKPHVRIRTSRKGTACKNSSTLNKNFMTNLWILLGSYLHFESKLPPYIIKPAPTSVRADPRDP